MNYQEKVKLFQETAGEDFTKGLTPLREALLREEIAELEEAIKNDDRVEILDALCDIKYVNDGNANYTDSKLDDSFEEVYYGWVGEDVNLLLDELKEIDLEYFHSINGAVYDLAFAFNFTLKNFKTALDRVHESNMSKFCNTREEAEETVVNYNENYVDSYYKQVGNKYVIYRTSDNKVLKSKYYHRVDLTDLI